MDNGPWANGLSTQSKVHRPQSPTRNPQSAIPNPQSPIRNPQSTNILPHRVARAKMTWHGRIHFLDRSGMAPVNSLLPQPTTAAKAARPVFQFRLRTLMLVLAVCSVGFATMLYVGPLWGLSLIFLILIIGAHIAGNAIGTSLRTRAPMEAPDRGALQRVRLPTTVPHRLQNRSRLGRSIAVSTLAGAACGVLLGRIVFLQFDQGQFSTGDWLLGLTSFAVIAGWLGFMASCFIRIGCGRS